MKVTRDPPLALVLGSFFAIVGAVVWCVVAPLSASTIAVAYGALFLGLFLWAWNRRATEDRLVAELLERSGEIDRLRNRLARAERTEEGLAAQLVERRKELDAAQARADRAESLLGLGGTV